jgi:hypothetical protein
MTVVVPVQFSSPLSGNEILTAYSVGSNGQPSGQNFQLTTGQIAALAETGVSPTFNNLTITGLFTESANVALTGGSAGQSTALALTAEINQFSTVASGTGAALPVAVKGLTILIANNGANPLQVYGCYNGGTNGDTIDGIATGTGVTQMQGSTTLYVCTQSYIAGTQNGTWTSNGIGEGYSGSLITQNYQTGVSAAGTSQATATQLVNQLAAVSTVTTGTGVNLPGTVVSTTTQSAGLEVTFINLGANALLVYPPQNATSDTINGQASTVGTTILPGCVAVFNSAANGVWTVQAASNATATYNTVASATSVTLTAAQITGGIASVDLDITGSTAITTFNTPSAAAIVGALHCPTVGTSYRLRIVNQTASTTSVLTAGSGVTVNGTTKTIPSTGWREFQVLVTAIGTPAVTFQSLATGTWS